MTVKAPRVVVFAALLALDAPALADVWRAVAGRGDPQAPAPWVDAPGLAQRVQGAA